MDRQVKAYVNTTLEALEEQFKILDKKLKVLYKKYSTNEEMLKKEMAMLMFEYEVVEERLKMTAKEQRQATKNINEIINQITMEEYALEKELIEEVKTLGKDLYSYKQVLLSVVIDLSMIPLDLKKLDKIIKTEIDGKLWSDRLWKNKKMVRDKLKLHLQKLVRGETDINKIKKDLFQTIKHKRYVTERLFRNELARVQTAIENEFCENEGIEWQLFIATLDGKTSEICRGYDGKYFKINDLNKPNPPTGTHINCRSCLVSVISPTWKPRTRRDNETKEIIKWITYKEWLKGK